MYKVTISGEVDEEEEYIKKLLVLFNDAKSIADVNDPLVAAEMLVSISNTRSVTVSVEKVS